MSTTTPATRPYDEENMKMAIQLSETAYQGGYMPFGAVLADAEGQIVVEAHNMSARAKKRGGSGDITRHAGETVFRRAG
jgi:tRNA(Arg) A34 adenosine deaminase TadA